MLTTVVLTIVVLTITVLTTTVLTITLEAYDDVADYFDIVKEPMHLELMLDRLDHKHYECCEDFM